jgi:chromosome partitioning protein
MNYVITVANQKGGVAKTTTVASLCGAMVGKSNRVLAIDLDAQSDLSLALGVNPSQVQVSSADILIKSVEMGSALCSTEIPGLDLIPSNNKMEEVERYLPMRQDFQHTLSKALHRFFALYPYDVAIIDCPPALGSVTANALAAAELLIIPTQPEYFSTHALRNMMTAIRQARMNGNPKLIYRILITMRDLRNRVHRDFNEQLWLTFGEGLFRTVIDVDTKLRESSIAGLPINYYKAKTRSSLQYQALAQELTAYVQRTVTKSEPQKA